MSKQRTWVEYAILVLVIILGFGAGALFQDLTSTTDEQFFIDNWKLSQHEHLLVEANKKAHDLQGALNKAEGDKSDLLDQIVTLKRENNRLAVLLTTTTTVSSGGDGGTLTVTNPVDCESPEPYEHLYKYENGLVVGDYKFDGEQHAHALYDLKVKSSVVVGDKDTSVIIKMATAYDENTWLELPVEADVVVIDDHNVIAPEISLGAAVMAPVFDVQPSLTVSWLHPTKSIDALSPKFGGTSNSYHAGVDVVSYRVSDHLPVVTDLWVSAGAVYTQNGVAGAITLGSKF